MKLGDKQRQHAHNMAKFKVWLRDNGYAFTSGDSYRDPRVFGHMGVKKGYGHRNSCHKIRLADDINLFKDGVYLTKSEDHWIPGQKWKSMDPDHRWGGDFKRPDGNHYSTTHNGYS